MKKIFILMLCIVLLIGTVSAIEWDNKLTYQKGSNGNPDLKVDFKNSFLGIIPTSDIGSIELKSHSSVDEIRSVSIGESVVMWYDFDFIDLYENGLGDVIIKEVKTGKIVDRNYQFVYWGNKIYEKEVYSCETILFKNGTLGNDCGYKLQNKTIEGWLTYDSRNIPKGKITIGIKFNILMEETLDFVWTIVGKKVSRHAVVSSGAIETIDGLFTVLTYNNNGTFNITSELNVSVLLIGGGASGGNGGAGGGGGAGGFNFTNEFILAPGNFNIIVGLGGTAQTGSNTNGNDGANSTFSSLTAEGGGGGSGGSGDGRDGGSGGGGASGGSGGTGSQGGDGGTGESGGSVNGGGGGGANENGANGGNPTDGDGGNGNLSSINGTAITYAGGGGGADNEFDPGDGGTGGGGAGGRNGANEGLPGTDGLGGGGGGGRATSSGAGGDGIVIIRYFTSDATDAPIITLNSPINNTNFTVNSITHNFTAFDGQNNITNTTLWIDDQISAINTTAGLNNVSYSFLVLGLSEGDHTWNGEACDFDGNCANGTERVYSIDSLNPALTISSPAETINFHFINTNLSVNWSVNDSNLDTCILEYEGSNRTLTCIDNSTSINITTILNRTLTIYANDTFGNMNASVRSWNYKVFENNQTFNAETTEGSLETFLADIKLGTGLSISSVSLIYNNSLNIGQSFAQGNSTILRKIDLPIPNVEANENVTFFWNLTLSDSTKINLTSHNQTIFSLDLDDCSTFTNELINFTIVDEEFQTPLPNATIEIAVNIFNQDRTTLILSDSSINTNVDTLSVCLNLNISTGIFYSLDTITRYEEVDHANEFYNIVNFSLTNGTATQFITLFDLNLTDSTEFQLTFTGSDFLPVENALVNVDRQYISENVFKTVELPKTDFNGQTVLHLVRNDVIYNLRISKDGKVLGNFENIVAFCEDFSIGDCKIELNAFDSVIQIFQQNVALGITYTPPVYNATLNTISFSFLTTDGTAKEVRLEVTRNDIFGNNSICNSTLVSSGGTLTCSIDPALEDTTLNTDIFVDDILTVVDIVQLDSTNFGVGGYLIMFIISMSFVLMFSGSKTGVLISLVLTLATSIGLGLVSSNLIGVGASGIWLLVMILLGIIKLNSDRKA